MISEKIFVVEFFTDAEKKYRTAKNFATLAEAQSWAEDATANRGIAIRGIVELAPKEGERCLPGIALLVSKNPKGFRYEP